MECLLILEKRKFCGNGLAHRKFNQNPTELNRCLLILSEQTSNNVETSRIQRELISQEKEKKAMVHNSFFLMMATNQIGQFIRTIDRN